VIVIGELMFCALYVMMTGVPACKFVGVEVNPRFLDCAATSVASFAVRKKWKRRILYDRQRPPEGAFDLVFPCMRSLVVCDND